MLLGARKFLALYLTGGLASSLCCVAWPYVAPKLDIPASYRVSKWTAALGASGAWCGFANVMRRPRPSDLSQPLAHLHQQGRSMPSSPGAS